jgi:hypothetical protein
MGAKRAFGILLLLLFCSPGLAAALWPSVGAPAATLQEPLIMSLFGLGLLALSLLGPPRR